MLESELFVDFERCAEEGPQSSLERNLIRAYLGEKGYKLEEVYKLPEEQARRLMIEACRYAAGKLAEIESRNKFRQAIQFP
jgi:hypothetical protein